MQKGPIKYKYWVKKFTRKSKSKTARLGELWEGQGDQAYKKETEENNKKEFQQALKLVDKREEELDDDDDNEEEEEDVEGQEDITKGSV